jgi:cytochrome o ubiquinol oxidase subunit II
MLAILTPEVAMIKLPNITFQMKLRHKLVVVFSLLLIAAIAYMSAKDSTFAILQPKGYIAQQQYDLLIFATLLSLIVVIPVFVLLAFILWRYREGNKKATYKPDWGGNLGLELVWWGVPIILIVILAVVTWQSSHALDPFKPLDSHKKPVRVQVIALQWKWLFIYPDHNVASVNYLHIPEDTPINFELTSDAPMNSFWIPQLGGQIYAMSGMTTKLHLMANEPGTYDGMSANISGEGFADMKFITKSTSESDFQKWITASKKSQNKLDQSSYDTLAKPSLKATKQTYHFTDKELYNRVINKYMTPSPMEQSTPMKKESTHTHHEGMSH